MNNIILNNVEVFVVIMYRFGDLDSHNYLLCITEDYNTAVTLEEEEADNRGGKYYGQITKRKINESKKFEVVRKLDDHPKFK